VVETINFFENTPVIGLNQRHEFDGAGVYAIYYVGEFPPYLLLSKVNKQECHEPIYIGKAVPSGWRQGRIITSTSAVLSRRLNEHVKSISQSKNLNLDDFRCRFVILPGDMRDLIVPVEAELIRRHTPLWNTVIDGFGNHDPGKGRYNQAKSEWDIFHPGRVWASRLKGLSPKRENIAKKVEDFLKGLKESQKY
jgi:hypothetical protein